MVSTSLAVLLTVANFLSWGHWPVFAKFAQAPTQPFGVVMVAIQTLAACLFCLATPGFVDALIDDSKHPGAVLAVFIGGAALAVGDFSAAAAVERLGIAVGGPICFSCMLLTGAIGDFLLEGSAHPMLFFCGVALCMCAVVSDSQSHPHRSADSSLASADSAAATAAAALEAAPAAAELKVIAPTVPTDAVLSMERPVGGNGDGDGVAGKQREQSSSHASRASSRQFRMGMAVAVGGGVVGGMWTVLSTAASHAYGELHPLVLLWWFHLGEAAFIVPVVLAYGWLFATGTTTLSALRGAVRALRPRQLAWTSMAGLAIAVGYGCYFATKGTVPRPVSYAFGCSAGTSTGVVWGLLFFREYEGATWRKTALLLLALALYPTSIAAIALSMK